ncbi:MAG TPA: Rieske 2Fe-2S domain-containing protein [Candidatus Binataceae bacterium]|nr:Rieske 2Fe-2S domain-containing protein [Candidatus Binataceae bacterium]
MLSTEDNETLCRVGADTPMGRMLREYWTPALRSETLEADGAPRRVRLLGDNFVAFRASDGRVGFFDEGCPHRCTSLALARNEDNALTCIFHGWKIDVSGKVVEVPSEPPERRAEFAAKVRVRHYPVREAGGIVWVYLGVRAQPPRFFDFEFTHLPPSHVMVRKAVIRHNWFQGMEGQLDSAHVGIMHKSWVELRGARLKTADMPLSRVNTGPSFEFMPRPYGFREGALRPLPDGSVYARIREVVLPYFSFIPVNPNRSQFLVCSIPVDDEWNAQWYIHYDPFRPLDEETRSQIMRGCAPDLDNFAANLGELDTMWGQDRKAMREGHWTGIVKSVQHEDFAVELSMGVIVDRSREYLGSSDSVIIRVRRALLNAVRDFAQGKPALGQEEDVDYSRIRPLAIHLPVGTDWRTVDSFDPPNLGEGLA